MEAVVYVLANGSWLREGALSLANSAQLIKAAVPTAPL